VLFVAELLLAVFGMLLVVLSEGRGATLLAAMIVAITMGAATLNIISPGPVIGTANHLGSIVILMLVGYVVARAVFGPGTVTGHRVRLCST
jgi:hypothetical protein